MIKDSRKKVMVVGSFVMDLIVTTERFPERGETVLGKTFSSAPGGKGANQAVQMAKLGLDVHFLGKLGDDNFGKILLESAKDSGVNVDRVMTDGTFSSVGNVQIEKSSEGTENRIIVVPGANMEITPEDVAFLEDDIRNYDLLVQQQEIPLEINRQIRRYANQQGVPVLLNPAPGYKLKDEDFATIDYIVPNETELLLQCGETKTQLENHEEAEHFARKLLAKGSKNVIVTLGSQGSLWVTEGESIYKEAVPGIKVLDPTAAGDSFIGALSYALLHDFNKADALAFANVVGGITVSQMGAQTSLCDKAFIIQWMKEHNQDALAKQLED